MTQQIGDGNVDELCRVGRDTQPIQIGGEGATVSFFGADPVAQADALTAVDTAITSAAPGAFDAAIQTLAAGGFGFVTSDEAQSVMQIIKNTQLVARQTQQVLIDLGLVVVA